MRHRAYSQLDLGGMKPAAPILLLFGLAAFVGFVLPPPPALAEIPQIRFIDALITLSLGILVWAAFRIIEPARFTYARAKVKAAAISLIWILLVLMLAIMLQRVGQDHLRSMHFDFMMIDHIVRSM